MKTLRLRLLALVSLSAVLFAASGCASFPANSPSSIPVEKAAQP